MHAMLSLNSGVVIKIRIKKKKKDSRLSRKVLLCTVNEWLQWETVLDILWLSSIELYL